MVGHGAIRPTVGGGREDGWACRRPPLSHHATLCGFPLCTLEDSSPRRHRYGFCSSPPSSLSRLLLAPSPASPPAAAADPGPRPCLPAFFWGFLGARDYVVSLVFHNLGSQICDQREKPGSRPDARTNQPTGMVIEVIISCIIEILQLVRLAIYLAFN